MRNGQCTMLRLRTWIFLSKNNGTLASIYKKYTEIDLVTLPLI